jgi:hypothetical protein
VTTEAASPVLNLSLDSLADAEIATLNLVIGGTPSGWLWHFAGPGHPKYLTQQNRVSRERLHKDRLIEQARVNGKKWVAPEETPEGVREGNVVYVIERLVGWSPIRIDGQDFPFTEDNARKILADPKRLNVLTQALEFLSADSSFTQRSAKT